MPSLRDPLLYTAGHHDDGWETLDAEPVWAEEPGRPAHFLEVPLPVVAAAYTKGVDAIYEASPLAGVLQSLHFTGFYRARWGMDDAPHVDHPDVPAIVEFEEDRRARAIRDNWPQGQARSDFESDLWHGYEILQALDLLSLCMCLVDLSTPSSDEEEVMARTLFSIDQEPSRRIILRAPRDGEADRVDLTVSVVSPGVVEIDPYPLAESEVRFAVPMRELEDRGYDSAGEAAEAYHAAPIQKLEFSVVGKTAARS